ncbi:hypothetical protein ACIGO6_36345 [Streptomyces sp. NPDC053750]
MVKPTERETPNSTKDRLYAVNADRSNVYEYAAASGTSSPIGSPRH